MELTQLNYFLTVVRLQHMTKASEALSITQPALSHAISKLEDELGVPLFERSGRTIQLNRYGKRFAESVTKALDELDSGKQIVQEWADPETGIISMSYLNILGAELVPKLIRSFSAKHPGISFDLKQGNHTVIVNQLDNGASDMAITSIKPHSDTYAWIPMLTAPLYVVVPSAHRFAGLKEIRFQQLEGEPFIEVKNSCGLNESLCACFGRVGFQPATTFEADDLMTVAGFVAAGLGISVLPQTNGLILDGLAWLPIADEGAICEVGLQTRRDRFLSPAAKRFIDDVHASFQ
ncbi:LysR family transcriptional regulator [Paenibacillus sp. NEAU-GSW1]|uniref:LysR family transcriptional regulator n=1 Tax=Paenibacillus sp. NEAU-GSW1 TaxID=2682486 RepID=UPI0012E2B89C|nr:LysR family transcriptional regulator [Paenibacillus sp. NEAU-GSW1]MUT68507.1 LysR family transcriptional regulator [Paenibacillus sp. NEAU-GSW1]